MKKSLVVIFLLTLTGCAALNNELGFDLVTGLPTAQQQAKDNAGMLRGVEEGMRRFSCLTEPQPQASAMSIGRRQYLIVDCRTADGRNLRILFSYPLGIVESIRTY